MTIPSTRFAPGPELFEWLRAENEPYLESCFVPPRDYSRLTEDTTVIVFGGSGSGKTALYYLLRRACLDANGKPSRLVVEWHPTFSQGEGQNGLEMARRLTFEALDTCALALAQYLSQHPSDLQQAPDWAQIRLLWFIRRSIQGDASIRLGPNLLTGDTFKKDLFDKIQSVALDAIVFNPTPEQLITELITGLSEIGMGGIWIMAEGFESWASFEPGILASSIQSFLSALSLLECRGFCFKFFMQAHLEPVIMRASGVVRRRVIPHHLDWEALELQQIIERRLSLMIREGFSLKDLCNAPGLLMWLKKVGGSIPREWLDQVQPLVRYYLENRLTKPISDVTWKELRQKHPPHFWMDETGHRVIVGGIEVSLNDLSVTAYKLLCYLYQRNGEIIGKDELYFRAYLGLENIPRTPDEKNYQAHTEYASLIDTTIFRLRQAIEPDPDQPVLIQTVRGHGIKLVSRW